MTATAGKHRLGLCIAIASAAILGIWPAATRGIYAEGGNVVFALLVTTWARALTMALFCMITGKALFQSRETLRPAITGGFFQTLSIIGLISALAFMQAPIVIIILYTHTLMLLLFMAWRGEIKLNLSILLTTITALIGLSLSLDLWNSHPTLNIIGFSLALLAAFATLSRLYIYNRLLQERHPIVVGAETFLIAGVFMLLTVLWEKPHLPHSPLGYGYVALGCAALSLGTFGVFYGISLIGSVKWSLFSKIEPIFTSLFSALLLGEILKPVQYLGIVTLIASLVAYQIAESKKAKKKIQPQSITDL